MNYSEVITNSFCAIVLGSLTYATTKYVTDDINISDNHLQPDVITYSNIGQSLSNISPVILQIDKENAKKLEELILQFCENAYYTNSDDRAFQRLSKAYISKRKIIRRLRELVKTGRRKYPLQTTGISEDIKQFELGLTDMINNMHSESSLNMQN